MSLKGEFNKMEDTCEFRGSYLELKKIVQAGEGEGVWRSYGRKKIKTFVSAKRDLELKWNPATGGVLFVANGDPDWREQRFPQPASLASYVPRRNWATIQSGPHAGMSLPELFLNVPCACINRYCLAEESLGEALDRDAAEIWEKLVG